MKSNDGNERASRRARVICYAAGVPVVGVLHALLFWKFFADAYAGGGQGWVAMILGIPFFYFVGVFFRLFPGADDGMGLIVVCILNGVLWGVVVVGIARRLS